MECWFERACGLKTLTSKKVRSYRPLQSLFAAISSLAPSCVLADAPERGSPVMGCRCGSMQTSLHTSDRRLAVRSLISLCLIDGKPPFGQVKACSTEKWEPQSQLRGTRDGYHPYHKHRASWKTLEAPFCWASSIARCSKLLREGLRRLADSCCCDSLNLWRFALASICSSRASNRQSGFFLVIKDFRGPVIWREPAKSSEAHFDRLLMPIPPSPTGRA